MLADVQTPFLGTPLVPLKQDLGQTLTSRKQISGDGGCRGRGSGGGGGSGTDDTSNPAKGKTSHAARCCCICPKWPPIRALTNINNNSTTIKH